MEHTLSIRDWTKGLLVSLWMIIRTICDKSINWLISPWGWYTNSSRNRWARWFYNSKEREVFHYQINPFYWKLGLWFSVDTMDGDQDCLEISFGVPFVGAIWLSFGFIRFKKKREYEFYIRDHGFGYHWNVNNSSPEKQGHHWSFSWDTLKCVESFERVVKSTTEINFYVPCDESYEASNATGRIEEARCIWLSRFGWLRWWTDSMYWEIILDKVPDGGCSQRCIRFDRAKNPDEVIQIYLTDLYKDRDKYRHRR